MNFTAELLSKLFEYKHNEFKNNYDYLRFGEKTTKNKKTIKNKAKEVLKNKGYVKLKHIDAGITKLIKSLSIYFDGFEFMYNKLENESSKNLLIRLILYRILGMEKVILIENLEEYWTKIKEIDAEKGEASMHNKLKLYTFNLADSFKLPIKIHHTILGMAVIFYLDQYNYKSKEKNIQVEKDDYVIDAGACRGETTLKFAHYAGKNGKVFSFEFINENLEIFNKNLDINPELKKQVTIIQKPLWDKSDTKLFFKEAGPGSVVSFEKFKEATGEVNTIAIDDFTQQYKIKKIDFLKMDIEGAEPKALAGAKQTIIKHKPKLAISIYHSLDDFTNIIKWIDNLNLGYKFYLGHHTIHLEETILYATTK